MVAGGLVLLGVALSFAFHVVFARMLSLDEGYLMITIRGFLDGHALYDPLFTQYGPAFYLYEWVARGLLHIPVTHDATRWLCLFHWLVASALLGLAGRRLTGSALAGLFIFAQSVVHLNELANEPGHPQELVIVLLALGVLVATRLRALGGLALIAAALLFIKINVGVFFGLAVALTMAGEISGRAARVVKGLLLAGCLALPFLLMRRHVELDWCRNYGALIAAALGGTCVLGLRSTGDSFFTRRDLFRAGAGFVISSVVFLGVAVCTGSSARALLDGLIVTPMQMPAMVLMPLPVSTLAALNSVLALATACFFLWRRPGAGAVRVFKLIFGVAGAFVCIGQPTAQLSALLPWVWLTLLPTGQGEARPHSVARIFLCFLAGTEAMQAYPVAGTQIANGTFLLVLAYAVNLADVVRSISLPEKITAGLSALSPVARRGLPAALMLALVWCFANVWCDWPGVRRAYAAAAPLNLPGSRSVRMHPGAALLFQDLTAYLRAESDGFISYPCLNSLYFWTEQRPPTLLNGSGWLQFDHAQQRQILDALLARSRPRLVLRTDMVNGWAQGAPLHLRPLVECVMQQCEPVRRMGPYTIFAPKAETKPNVLSARGN